MPIRMNFRHEFANSVYCLNLSCVSVYKCMECVNMQYIEYMNLVSEV